MSRIFRHLAQAMNRHGTLRMQLIQADIPLNPVDYLSIALFSAAFFFVATTGVVTLAAAFAMPMVRAAGFGLLAGVVVAVAVLFHLRSYPRLLLKRRVIDIERNLLPTLKHLNVQVRSGVPVYDALVSAARGNYGLLSAELGKVVREIDTGTSLPVALDHLAVRNPSFGLRRAVWQITNSFAMGGELGLVLNIIIDSMTGERMIAIRRYGSQLNPLSLIYMMVAVIMPALGITFLIVMSSFSGLGITEQLFWIILGGVTVFQFFYLGMIKSRRPAI